MNSALNVCRKFLATSSISSAARQALECWPRAAGAWSTPNSLPKAVSEYLRVEAENCDNYFTRLHSLRDRIGAQFRSMLKQDQMSPHERVGANLHYRRTSPAGFDQHWLIPCNMFGHARNLTRREVLVLCLEDVAKRFSPNNHARLSSLQISDPPVLAAFTVDLDGKGADSLIFRQIDHSANFGKSNEQLSAAMSRDVAEGGYLSKCVRSNVLGFEWISWTHKQEAGETGNSACSEFTYRPSVGMLGYYIRSDPGTGRVTLHGMRLKTPDDDPSGPYEISDLGVLASTADDVLEGTRSTQRAATDGEAATQDSCLNTADSGSAPLTFQLSRSKDGEVVFLHECNREFQRVYALPGRVDFALSCADSLAILTTLSPRLLLDSRLGVEYLCEHRKGYVYVATNMLEPTMPVYRRKLESVGGILDPKHTCSFSLGDFSKWELVYSPPEGCQVSDLDMSLRGLTVYGTDKEASPFVHVVQFTDLSSTLSNAEEDPDEAAALPMALKYEALGDHLPRAEEQTFLSKEQLKELELELRDAHAGAKSEPSSASRPENTPVAADTSSVTSPEWFVRLLPVPPVFQYGTVKPGLNADFNSRVTRFEVSNPVTPPLDVSYNFLTGSCLAFRSQEYNPGMHPTYDIERVYVKSRPVGSGCSSLDETRVEIPLTIVSPKTVVKEPKYYSLGVLSRATVGNIVRRLTPWLGPHRVAEAESSAPQEPRDSEPHSSPCEPRPTLTIVYGAYGKPADTSFNPLVSLLVHSFGWRVVFAHVRGGNDRGFEWHKEATGSIANKQKSVVDFLSCCQYLVDQQLCTPSQLCAMGFSAGGFTIANALQTAQGASLIQGAAVLHSPFVDVVRTLCGNESEAADLMDQHEFGFNVNESEEYSRALCPVSKYELSVDGPGERSDQYLPIPRVKCRVLVSAAHDDDRTPLSGIARYVALLRAHAERPPYKKEPIDSQEVSSTGSQSTPTESQVVFSVRQTGEGGHFGHPDINQRTDDYGQYHCIPCGVRTSWRKCSWIERILRPASFQCHFDSQCLFTSIRIFAEMYEHVS